MASYFNTYGGRLTTGNRLKQTITNQGKDQLAEIDIKTETIYVYTVADLGSVVGGFIEVKHNPTGLSSAGGTVYELHNDIVLTLPIKFIGTGTCLITIAFNRYTLTYTGTATLLTNTANPDMVIILDGEYGGRVLLPPASGGTMFGLSSLSLVVIADMGLFGSAIGSIANCRKLAVLTSSLFVYAFSTGLTINNVISWDLNAINIEYLSAALGTPNNNQVVFTIAGATPTIGSITGVVAPDAQSTHKLFNVDIAVPVGGIAINGGALYLSSGAATNDNLFKASGQSQLTNPAITLSNFFPFEDSSANAFLYFASPNTTATTGGANVDRVIQGTPITELQFFTYDAGTGTFTYTGIKPRRFQISALASLTGTNGVGVSFWIYIAGSPINYVPDIKLAGATTPVDLLSRFFVKLLPNQTVRLAIQVDTTAAVTAKNFNVQIL
jgi:hypothetical protein